MTEFAAPRSLPQSNALPPEMVQLPQWVVYRLEQRSGQDKPTKVPYRVDGLGHAKSTDPSTWGTFDAALDAAPAFDGLGFVFAPGDGLWGLDLDGCCPEPFGPPVPEAAALVRALATYCEHSPSGTGLHAICRAVHPERARHRALLCEAAGARPAVHAEAYDRGRYFTVTGAALPGVPLACTDQQWAVDAMCRPPGLFAPKERRLSSTPPAVAREMGDQSDAELLDKMFRAKNGAAIRRLWQGDRTGYGSNSEADMALVSHLLYWTDGDHGRADRLFRSSGLMREKWDERRGALTYGERTIEAIG